MSTITELKELVVSVTNDEGYGEACAECPALERWNEIEEMVDMMKNEKERPLGDGLEVIANIHKKLEILEKVLEAKKSSKFTIEETQHSIRSDGQVESDHGIFEYDTISGVCKKIKDLNDGGIVWKPMGGAFCNTLDLYLFRENDTGVVLGTTIFDGNLNRWIRSGDGTILDRKSCEVTPLEPLLLDENKYYEGFKDGVSRAAESCEVCKEVEEARKEGRVEGREQYKQELKAGWRLLKEIDGDPTRLYFFKSTNLYPRYDLGAYDEKTKCWISRGSDFGVKRPGDWYGKPVSEVR